MLFATWNVNSIKVRLSAVIDWLQTQSVDALVIEETKSADASFPVQAFHEAGFDVVFVGQNTYNGVALVTRTETVTQVNDVVRNLPDYPDEQKRFIAATLTLANGRTVCFAGAYFPNGQELGCAKYLYKLDWICALNRWVRVQRATGIPLILGGDFNIAPHDDDVWDPHSWKDTILVSGPERTAYRNLLEAGLADPWSLEIHPEHTYSWWDYRQSGFERNQGLRIDHLLCSPDLLPAIDRVWIDTAPRGREKPSDHAPVIASVFRSDSLPQPSPH